MSNYFRSAARCDQSVAAEAPVPLYNVPEPIYESNAEQHVLPPSDGDEVTFAQRPVALYTSSAGSLTHTRALLDHQHHTEERLKQKRESNVLTKLALREDAMKKRLKEEERLNARLMDAVRSTFPHSSSQRNEDDEAHDEETAAASLTPSSVAPPSTVVQQQRVSPVAHNSHDSNTSKLGLRDTIAMLQEVPKSIPLFQLIQIEEERNARRVLVPTTSQPDRAATIKEKRTQQLKKKANNKVEGEITLGSIQAMYNDLTLNELRDTFPDVPPSVLVEKFQRRLLPTESAQSTLLVGSGPEATGAAEVAEVIHRTTSHAQRLRAALEHIRETERLSAEERAAQLKERDKQNATVLVELVTQDRLRQKAAEDRRLYQLVKYHEHTLLGSFVSTAQRVSTTSTATGPSNGVLAIEQKHGGGHRSADTWDADVERVLSEPSLPKVPENVRRALMQSRKPPHPIDMYQAKVRAEMGIVD